MIVTALLFLAAQAAQPSAFVTVALPILIAVIGASGSWLSYRAGVKRSWEVQNAHDSTALQGYAELTNQMQEQLSHNQTLIATLQERVDECFADRADLRTQLGVLQGKYEVLHAELERVRHSDR